MVILVPQKHNEFLGKRSDNSFGHLHNQARDMWQTNLRSQNNQKKIPSLSYTMGNMTKAARARLANLSKAGAKCYKATVEDCSDTDDLDYTPDLDTVSNSSDGDNRLHEEEPSQEPEDIYFAFDGEESLACPLEEDSESEGSEFDETDITDDATLLTFANVLRLAQEAGLEAEQKADKAKKRPKCYKGNSKRSLRRFHANREAIAAAGKQGFISSWLTASAKNVEVPLTSAPTSVSQYILNFDRLSSLRTRRHLWRPLNTCVKKKNQIRMMKHREMQKDQGVTTLLNQSKIMMRLSR
jgi:hypothetical protein